MTRANLSMTRNIDVEVTGSSRVELFPLRVKQDAREFIAGRPATGSYVALSDGALEAAALLSGGRTVQETKAALARGNPVSAFRLRPLIETLLSAGLVKSVDGVPLPEPLAPRRYHLTWLRRHHVAWLFSRSAAVCYAALVSVGLGIVLGDPGYLPRVTDLIVVSSPIVNLALLWGVSGFAMAAHELAHLLAATFLGVQASFALSNRLFFAVAQTDLTDVWLVDRRKRYLAYAAGMANDILFASACVTALWLHDQGLLPLPHLLHGALRLAILVLALGVFWQFNFYLRTDVYYLIANFTGCRNLSQDAAAYLKRGVSRLFGRPAPEPLAGVPEEERRLVRGFAVLMLLGTAGVLALGAAYLGAFLMLLLGGPGSLFGAARPAHPGRPATLFPAFASLALTGCWLAYAIATKRRRRPRVGYRLRAPEDL